MTRGIKHCSIVMSLLAAVALAPTAASAQHKCDNPRTAVDVRACAKAAEGGDALRAFVSRTRMIYQLDFWDYARRAEMAVETASAAPQKTVTVEAR